MYCRRGRTSARWYACKLFVAPVYVAPGSVNYCMNRGEPSKKLDFIVKTNYETYEKVLITDLLVAVCCLTV